MILYHGTSDIFKHKIYNKGILSPIETGYSCEKRKQNLDKVFLTDNRKFAEGYAIRSVLKHGGRPIVIEVDVWATPERIGRVNQWVIDKVEQEQICCSDLVTNLPESEEELIDLMVKIFSGTLLN